MPKTLFELSAWRGPLLWVVLALALVGAAGSISSLIDITLANRAIRALGQHQDVAVDARWAPPEEILARINEDIERDRIDDAQTLLNSAGAGLPPDIKAAALYNVANARTRQGAAAVQKGDYDGGTALVNLAKSEYRMALKIDPQNWDYKFNIDVAMRVVRDLPLADSPSHRTLKTPKQIWYEIPGVPRGLP
jgi:mxaK protein